MACRKSPAITAATVRPDYMRRPAWTAGEAAENCGVVNYRTVQKWTCQTKGGKYLFEIANAIGPFCIDPITFQEYIRTGEPQGERKGREIPPAATVNGSEEGHDMANSIDLLKALQQKNEELAAEVGKLEEMVISISLRTTKTINREVDAIRKAAWRQEKFCVYGYDGLAHKEIVSRCNVAWDMYLDEKEKVKRLEEELKQAKAEAEAAKEAARTAGIERSAWRVVSANLLHRPARPFAKQGSGTEDQNDGNFSAVAHGRGNKEIPVVALHRKRQG